MRTKGLWNKDVALEIQSVIYFPVWSWVIIQTYLWSS